MKINFLGDSITEGYCANPFENRYSTLVAKYFNAEECNFGVSGSRIAKQIRKTNNPDDNVFMLRAIKMDTAADFTFVFGGTNDFGHGDAKLGKMGDTDTYTFYGAFTELVAYLATNFPKNKLCFILPLPRYDQDNVYGDGSKEEAGAPLSLYIQAEKEILEKYKVPYLDLSSSFPVPQSNQGDALTQDGLHPNNQGHRLLADKLIAVKIAFMQERTI